MPLSLHIHPCPTARDRDHAHEVQRKLKLRDPQTDFWTAVDRLKACYDDLKRPEHYRHTDLVLTSDGFNRPCAIVKRYNKPVVTLTQMEA